ncbi:MAG: ribonuclease domain-containing protein [Burkholderiaceae bacterium]
MPTFLRSFHPARWLAAAMFGALLACAGLLHSGEAVARGVDPSEARIAWVDASELPVEAQRMLATIQRGGPFASAKDGIVFFNREKLLPYRPRGYYTEYTVRTPGVRNRGARRIIAGGDPRTSGVYYYTEDHYQSFRRIRE